MPTILDNVGFVATTYVFGALGGVYLLDPTALENWSTTAASYGIGLRINDGVRGTRSLGSLSLEFGNQQRSDRTPTNTRFTVFFSQRSQETDRKLYEPPPAIRAMHRAGKALGLHLEHEPGATSKAIGSVNRCSHCQSIDPRTL